MRLDVDDRVGCRAEVELPVVQHQPEVPRAVTLVHHHLRDVDRPTFREDPAPQDRPCQRRASVRVDALEVVSGHRLVDDQKPQHPVVVLPQV